MKISIRNFGLLSVICLCSFAASAQSRRRIDSVKQVLNTQLPDTTRVFALGKLSGYYQMYYPDSCLAYAQQALSLAEKIHYDEGIFWSFVAVSGALGLTGNYPLELDYAFKAFSLSKKINRPATNGFARGMLSDYYYNLGEYSNSLRYWREVTKIIEQSFPDEMYSAWGGLSRIFVAMNQSDSAMFYARKLYEKAKHIKHPNEYEARVILLNYTLLGNAFAAKFVYDSALLFYWKGVHDTPPMYLDINVVECINGIATVHKATGKLDSAVIYSEKVLRSKTAKSYPVSQLKAANLLLDIYVLRNKPDSTLKYLRMAVGLKDTLFNREKMLAIHNLTYKEQEKQQEIEAAEMKLENQYILYSSLAAFIALVVIAGVIMRNKRQMQLQSIRNSIADDLHDDIGSTLSSISIMSELAKAKSGDSILLLESIGESTLTIQENMSDIVWAIKAGNDRFENVLQRMNQFASEILEAKNIELDFRSDASLSASRLSMEQRKNIYLFFKEAVNNAVKYSGATKVFIHLTQKGQYVELNVRDNGKGFDTTKTFNGNGMKSLQKRATELRGDFEISSLPNEGTVAALTFKIT